MTFGYDNEQQQLADGAQRFFAREWDHARRRELIAGGLAMPKALWRQMADLGWLGIGIPAEQGGSGGGALETTILAEAIGNALAPVPYLGSIVLCAPLLMDKQPRSEALLSSLIAGKAVVSLAVYEPDARFQPLACATTATRSGKDFVIRGRKNAVLDGAAADTFLVLAQTSANENAKGLSLFALPAAAAGVTVQGYRTYDCRLAADVSFDSVVTKQADIIGHEGGAGPVVECALDRGIVALCAEAVGGMQAAYDLTITHVKTRRQFGGLIGRFQTLQHRLVDMYVAIEESRSLMLAAAFSLDAAPDERRRLVSAAKLRIGRLGRFVAEQAVQTHGAIAISDEYKLGDYFKLLRVADTLFGDADHHAGLLGRQLAA